MGWRYGSSGRAPGLQVQISEFKSQSYLKKQKTKKKKEELKH
jgi:hypothetical protein